MYALVPTQIFSFSICFFFTKFSPFLLSFVLLGILSYQEYKAQLFAINAFGESDPSNVTITKVVTPNKGKINFLFPSFPILHSTSLDLLSHHSLPPLIADFQRLPFVYIWCLL